MYINLVTKKVDPGTFTIPRTIRFYQFANALCDLRESINLMPLAIFNKLELGASNPMAIKLLMVDYSIKRLIRI